jgi:hypothetical protein
MNTHPKFATRTTEPSSHSLSSPWAARLEALRSRTAALGERSRWTVEWAIYRWATEQLKSAAIRIDGSEGLSGPAPARWRLLTHIEPETGALALAVLDGRARLLAANVIAALLSSDDEAVVAIRGGGIRRWQRAIPSARPRVCDGVARSIDIALDRSADASNRSAGASTDPGPLPQKLALALALHERGGP